MTIPNKDIAELAEALANARAPTRAEILHAMTLAYGMGKTDGAIELADRQLKRMVKPSLGDPIDDEIEEDERAFENRYAAEHPDDDYLGRPV